MSEIELNPKLKESCEIFGHETEYFIESIGMCYYCKEVNPRFYHD